jgi:hypothetical protein
MMFDSSLLHVKTGFSEPLSLQRPRQVCPGMVRATQLLKLGAEVIATDEVLFEEVAYPTIEKLQAEVASFGLKAGLFSSFSNESTPPPKYIYTDEKLLLAWFVTPVPVVTLGAVLDELDKSFPPRYTWNRAAFLRDTLRVVSSCVRRSWRGKRRPLRALRETWAAVREQRPRRLPSRQRLQLAAMLVEAVRKKHLSGIYQNNIVPQTVFFTHATSPRFLDNYSGLIALAVEEQVPQALLSRDAAAGFGVHFQDTYGLALISYRIITGQQLPGRDFVLDPQVETRRRPPWPQAGSARLPSFLKKLLGYAARAKEALGRVSDAWNAMLDESTYVRFRTLNRAGGSALRSIPYVRKFINIVFPTKAAWALRLILDRPTNESVFGPATGVLLPAATRKNADCSLLRKALASRPLAASSLLGRCIQQIIDAETAREKNSDSHNP